MNAIQQYALYNLLPALVGGAIAWAAIGSAIYLLGVRHGKLRLCLLSVPLLKSTLLLLGVGLVLPWPRDVFGTWHAQALSPTRVFPFFLLFTGAAIAARTLLAARARRQALAGATAAESSSPRLSKALDEVIQETHQRRQIIIDRCGFAPKLARPDLLVATSPLSSPLIVTDEAPTIVFPANLIDRLSDQELRGALAHELAHLELRTPFSCFSSASVQSLAVANPLASIMAGQLYREEEKACDDMAVAATGDPETYAGMLLKAYRFAHPRGGSMTATLQYVPQLLGLRPMLAERIERLMGDETPGERMGWQYAGFAAIWIGIVAVFFVQ